MSQGKGTPDYRQTGSKAWQLMEQMQVPAPVAGLMNDPQGMVNHLREHKIGTIRNVLQMSSGVQWNEDYDDPESDVSVATWDTLSLYE